MLKRENVRLLLCLRTVALGLTRIQTSLMDLGTDYGNRVHSQTATASAFTKPSIHSFLNRNELDTPVLKQPGSSYRGRGFADAGCSWMTRINLGGRCRSLKK